MLKVDHWIFLRGLAHEAGHWGKFVEQFGEHFNRESLGVKVHTLDLPGAGVNWEVKAPLSITETTKFVRAQFQKLGLQGRCVLFSMSLGSMVAFDWINRYPDEFKGVVLINTSFGGFSPPYKRLAPSAYPTALRLPFAKTTRDREFLTLGMVSNRTDLYEETAKEWAAIHERHPIKKSVILRQLWAATFFRPPRAKPRIPTLLLGSAADQMVHPSCSEVIAKAWGLPLFVNQAAGHDLILDDPTWVLGKVSEWLKASA